MRQQSSPGRRFPWGQHAACSGACYSLPSSATPPSRSLTCPSTAPKCKDFVRNTSLHSTKTAVLLHDHDLSTFPGPPAANLCTCNLRHHRRARHEHGRPVDKGSPMRLPTPRMPSRSTPPLTRRVAIKQSHSSVSFSKKVLNC